MNQNLQKLQQLFPNKKIQENDSQTDQKNAPNIIQILQNENDQFLLSEKQLNLFKNEQEQINQELKEKNPNDILEKQAFKTFQTFIPQQMADAINDDIKIFGNPTVMKKIKNFIAIGTDQGMVIMYDIQSQFQTTVQVTKDKYKGRAGPVTSLDVSFDFKIIAIGYQNGFIDLIQLDNQYKFDTYKDLHTSSICQLKFIHENTNSLEYFELISADISGQIHRLQIQVYQHFGRIFTTINKLKLISEEEEQQYQLSRQSSIISQPDSQKKQNESEKKDDNQSNSKNNSNIKNKDLLIDIQLLTNNFSQKYIKQKIKLLALVFEKKGIIIIRVAIESAKIVHQLPSIPFIDKNQIPLISWGEGGLFNQSDSYILLLVGWGNYLFLIKMQYFEREVNLVNASSILIQNKVVFCSFLSNSIVLVIHGQSISILHTSEFQIGFTEQNEPLNLKSSFKIEGQFNFQQQSKLSTVNKFIDCSFDSNQIYILYQNKIIYCKLIHWEEFFRLKTKSGDWQNILQLAKLVDEGKIKYLGGIHSNPQKRKKIMQIYFQELSINFVSSQLSNSKPDKNTTKNLKLIIDFLLQTDNSNFLFTSICDSFRKSGLYSIFLSVVQIFINNKQITFIPDQALDDFIQYFIDHQRFDFLQKMLLSLQIQQSQIQYILKIAKQHKLFRVIAYISTKYKKDFLTPLNYIKDEFLIQYQQVQNQKNLEKEAWNRIMWYISLCFKCVVINGDKMRYNEQIQMISDIINFLKIQENLHKLIQVNPEISLNHLLYQLFDGELAEIIFENSNILYEQIFKIQDCNQEQLNNTFSTDYQQNSNQDSQLQSSQQKDEQSNSSLKNIDNNFSNLKNNSQIQDQQQNGNYSTDQILPSQDWHTTENQLQNMKIKEKDIINQYLQSNQSFIHQLLINIFQNYYKQLKNEENLNQNLQNQFLHFFARIYNLRIFQLDKDLQQELFTHYIKSQIEFDYLLENYINNKQQSQIYTQNPTDISQFDLVNLLIQNDEEQKKLKKQQSYFRSDSQLSISSSTSNISDKYQKKQKTKVEVLPCLIGYLQLIRKPKKSVSRQPTQEKKQENIQNIQNNNNKDNNQKDIQTQDPQKNNQSYNILEKSTLELSKIIHNGSENTENNSQQQIKDHVQNIKTQQKSIFLLNLLINCADLLSKSQIMEIINQSSLLKLFTISVYLYSMNEQYDEALQIFINNQDQDFSQSVFTWLNYIFAKHEQKEYPYIKSLKNTIIQNFDIFLKISEIQSIELFDSQLKNFGLEILEKLKGQVETQLTFMKHVIAQPKSQILKDIDVVKIKYIDLLAQQNPKEVIKEIKNMRNFPMDKILEICQNKNIKKAEAYIYQRQGNYRQALQIFSKIFIDYLQTSTRMFQQKNISFNKEKIRKKLDYNLELCLEFQQQEEDETKDTLWFEFCDKVIKYITIKNLTSKTINSGIQEILCFIVSQIFETMCTNLEMNYVIEKFTSKYGSIPLKVFKNTNNSVKSLFEFINNTHKSTQKDIAQTIGKLNIDIKNKQGQKFDLIQDLNEQECLICKKSFQHIDKSKIDKNSYKPEQNCIQIFFCGHFYHQTCLKQKKMLNECYICKYSDKITILSLQKTVIQKNKKLNQGQKEQTDSYSSSPNIIKKLSSNQSKFKQSGITEKKQVINKKIQVLQQFDNQSIQKRNKRYGL